MLIRGKGGGLSLQNPKKPAVFVHVPKTGGASILQICMHHGVRVIDHDLRNPVYRSLSDVKNDNPDVYSFAIVRNPWDRVVSAYHYLRKGGIKYEDRIDAENFVNQYADFGEFVANAFIGGAILRQIHFIPQYQWLSDESGLIVDQVGKFEKLQLHVSRWLKTIGLPAYILPHVNQSSHESYKNYYSDNTIKIVRRVYARDIELFKYKF